MIKNISKFLFSLVLFYFLLIITDYGLKKYFVATSFYEKEVAPIVEKRNLENKKLKIEALKNGYRPLMQPNIWIEPELELFKIAMKKNIIPLTGVPFTKVYLCNEGYGLVKYTTDRFGLRNPDDVWEKDIDIMFVGDSSANGACAEEKYSIPGQFRKNYNVINLASNGNETAHYISLIHTFSKYFKPEKALILIFHINDFAEKKSNVFHKFILDKYIHENREYFNINNLQNDKPQNLSNDIIEIFDLSIPIINKMLDAEVYDKKYKESFIFKRIPRGIKRHYSLPEYRKIFFAEKEIILPENIKSTLEMVSKNCGLGSSYNRNCKPIVIFVPASEYWKPGFKNNYYRDALNNFILNNNSDIKFYDSSKDLEALGMNAYSPLGGHLSIEGYEAISDKLKLLLIND